MKKILFLLLLFAYGTASAQTYSKTMTQYGNTGNRIKADSVQHVPRINDTLRHTTDTSAQIRVVNGQLMVLMTYWQTVVTSSTPGSSANWDSAYARRLQSLAFSAGTLTATLGSGQTLIATGIGTLTSFSFTNSTGITGTVSNSTTTPALSLVIDTAAISNFYAKVRSLLTAGTGISIANGIVTSTITQYTDALARASLSFSTGSGAYNSSTGVITIPTNNNQITNGAGYITTNQTITLSGDASGSGTTAITATLATVNSNVGTFGSATQSSVIVINGKGLVTGASNVTITPAVSSITGLGTGVSTFLATPSSANLAAAVTDETGSGALVFDTSPTITGASLGSSTATTQTPADNSTKVATTAYVDNALSGQRQKEAVKYATTGALPSVVYANGSSGVGATLTGVALGAISLDGASPSVNDRVLVKNQASSFQNGLYIVTTTGSGIAVFVLTRATDFDQAADIQTGDMVFVTAGTTLTNTTWAYNAADSPVIGTDAITFTQTAGQGSFTGGNGITITGTSIAIDLSVTVDKNTSQTLTNKTIAAGSNTITGLTNSNLSGSAAISDANISSSTNWNTAYTNRITSLTTTGSSGAATLSSNTLNIPNYTLTGLGGVASTRSLTINGSAQDLSADRTWTITTTGTSNRISVSGGAGLTPTIDIASTYVGQTSITTLGTIATGTWQATSISTTYTDAKIKTVTGTTNRLTVGGTSTDPTFDISTSYVGQSTITTLGTIATGVWNGTAIGDTYISSASTWNAKQAALSGTGFVKISGTTISYDNSTYLTTSSAATTYFKIDASNGPLTGNVGITKSLPTLTLTTNSGNSGAAIQLLGWSNTNSNWQISDALFNATLEFTPSTAAGGSTFTTPVITFSSSGLITANSFTGAGTGLTGTASGLSIGGNSATVTISNNFSNTTYPVLFNGGSNVVNSTPGITINPFSNIISAASFTGSLTGNASSATILQTARTINGVSFDGSANITVTAAASTLTGSTLASGITASSLTSAAGGTFGTNAFNSTAYLPTAGGTMSGSIAMGGNNITGAGTGAFAGTGAVIVISGGGTSTMYQKWNSTGGNYFIGPSSSTGTGLLSGVSAYSFAIVTESARDLVFGTNNTLALTINSSQNATFAGSILGTSASFGTSTIFSSAQLQSAMSASSGTSFASTPAALRLMNTTSSGKIKVLLSDNVTQDANISFNPATGLFGLGSGTNNFEQFTINTSGQITINTANNLKYLNVAGATTGYVYQQASNSGGGYYLAVESSSGGTFGTGTSAYASLLLTTGATSLQFGTNDAVNMTIANGGATNFTSSVTATDFFGSVGTDVCGSSGGFFTGSTRIIRLNIGGVSLYLTANTAFTCN